MSTQRVILQLNLQVADGQRHVLQQMAVLPLPVLPGIFLTNCGELDIPRVAPEGAPVETVIRGVVLDVASSITICILPAVQAVAYSLDEWLAQHPRWQHVSTEPPQTEKPDWLTAMGDFEEGPQDG